MKVASLIFTALFATARSDGCGSWTYPSDQWYQEPTGGNCFKTLSIYDSFCSCWETWWYDAGDFYCNESSGRVLASIHSKEENDFIAHDLACYHLPDESESPYRNIGLRCVGNACKWDDGSPLTYTNFKGAAPSDDGVTRCYTIRTSDNGQWTERDCGSHQGDCWVCSMPQQMDCAEGETAHKNGCVSVHLTPLDFKSAEESCPGGGHLVSIHGWTENNWYASLATNAGINGTVYIGGQFTQGDLVWTDGSHPSDWEWATSFPNSIFGSCVQMLLASEFGAKGQWTNVDCAAKQPYMCFRDGAVYGPTIPPPIEHTPATCPPIQYFTTGSGTIYSPNFPLSIPSNQGCEYVIGTDEKLKASIQFVKYDCKAGTTLSLYDGINGNQPFATFTSNSPSNLTYTASSNVMKIVFTASASTVGTGWKLQYFGA